MRIERFDWDGREPADLARRLRSLVPAPADLGADVEVIIERVRREGDRALRELTARYDATAIDPEGVELRVGREEIDRARAELDAGLAEAMELLAANVRSVCEAEAAGGPARAELEQGQTVTVVERAVASAGIYAPGGRVAYPSTVLMCCIPARVAGVERVALATPPGPEGRPSPITLAACRLAGVDEVYAVGGAQAIAALAVGTESIEPVDMIAGPGNPFVNEAKRQLFGEVGIDGLAGPSELVVISDGTTDSATIALDLLAQAEHGPDAPLIVVATAPHMLEGMPESLAELAAERPTVLDAPAALVVAPDLAAAVELSDAVAPEHLELLVEGGEELANDRVAGCVFVGPGAATALGDYAAGSNHVLPTGGSARFGGPLGPSAFTRRTSVVSIPATAANALAPAVGSLSRAEGLPVHGESVAARVSAARKR